MKRPRKHIPYTVSRVARIAYLAGSGCSAAEIAAESGMKTGAVYKVLSDYRISLVPKNCNETAFQLVVSKRTHADAGDIARDLSVPVPWMLARLLEAVVEERTLAINLLDGVSAPE